MSFISITWRLNESFVKPLWWDVVEAMAELVLLGQDESELTQRQRLDTSSLDFSDDEIQNACNFIEKAQISGTLSETLSMLGPQIEGVRVPHPKEDLFFNQSLETNRNLSSKRFVKS